MSRGASDLTGADGSIDALTRRRTASEVGNPEISVAPIRDGRF